MTKKRVSSILVVLATLAVTALSVGCGAASDSAVEVEEQQTARAQETEERKEEEALERREQRESEEWEAEEEGESESEPEGEPEGESEESGSECDPNYEGACLDPTASDYDCEGGSGSGSGPYYTGEVTVVGVDHYGLDADGDGIGCESE